MVGRGTPVAARLVLFLTDCVHRAEVTVLGQQAEAHRQQVSYYYCFYHYQFVLSYATGRPHTCTQLPCGYLPPTCT